MIRFIDEDRGQFGVEFLCRVLRDVVPGFVTSRVHRAAKTRVPSARQLPDELLVPEIRRLHEDTTACTGCGRCMHCCDGRGGTSAATRLPASWCSRGGAVEEGVHHEV